MPLQSIVKQTLHSYSSNNFKPTTKNVELVSELCIVFIRILQEEAEKEQRELNLLRKLNNRRERKTIPNLVYIKVLERLLNPEWSNFNQGVEGQLKDKDTSISKEVIV